MDSKPESLSQSEIEEKPEIIEKEFNQEETKAIFEQESSKIETVEGYTPKDNPVRSILKKNEKKSKFKANKSGNLAKKKEVKNVKFLNSNGDSDTDNEYVSSNTSSEDECEFDQLVDTINQSSYLKLNMFLMSICDKNRLINFVEHKNREVQNSEVDKLDIFTARISNEFKKLVPATLDEEFKIQMLSEITRLLTYMDYHYESIPSFSSEEYRSILALFSRFIVENKLIDDLKQDSKNSNELLSALDDKDYHNLLYESLNIY